MMCHGAHRPLLCTRLACGHDYKISVSMKVPILSCWHIATYGSLWDGFYTVPGSRVDHQPLSYDHALYPPMVI